MNDQDIRISGNRKVDETPWTKFELNSREINNRKRPHITELFALFSAHYTYLFLSVVFTNYFKS